MGASCKSFCHASVQGPGFRTYFQYLSSVHRLLATRLIGTASHRSHQRRKSCCFRHYNEDNVYASFYTIDVYLYELVRQAEQLSDEVSDLGATRALLRLKARVFRELGDLRGALAALQTSMEISKQLQEPSGDADTLGEIADVYVEMGDMETAAQYYDMCITAIEDETTPSLSSTWDL